MGSVETIVLIIIVSVAALYTGRAIYRIVTRPKKACACDEACPIGKHCDETKDDHIDIPNRDLAKGK